MLPLLNADGLVQAKTRMGLRMVALYGLLYGAFVLLHIFWPQLPARQLAGLSLGLLLGLVLLLVSLLLALLYHVLCCRLERRHGAAGERP